MDHGRLTTIIGFSGVADCLDKQELVHPVARILSRLLQEASFATIFQAVYFIFFLYFSA
jgi:hypothetical protein